MTRKYVSKMLSDLKLSQLCLSRLCRTSNVRINRFLNGSLELHPEEMLRLSAVLNACLSMQKGTERLATNYPINWNQSVDVVEQKVEERQNVEGSDFAFCGDIDFSSECPTLLFAIPKDILRSLIEGGPGRSVRIEFHEVAKLLMRIVENPDTSEINREEAKALLKIAADSSYSAEADREVINHLLALK
jgi:hypothetical protein